MTRKNLKSLSEHQKRRAEDADSNQPSVESEADGLGYDLICGQGRLEAFIALGHKEIPAVVVEISKEERLIRSLVENLARRYPQPMALIREIERLKSLGYDYHQISKKLDVSDTTVKGLMGLKIRAKSGLLKRQSPEKSHCGSRLTSPKRTPSKRSGNC